MKIRDLLDKRAISLTAAPKTKSEALDMAIDLMVKSEKISDKEAYRKQVYAREEESTTGIGEGIAIPHGKCDAVKAPGLAAMVIKDGVDFQSLDGEPAELLFLIAAPNTKDNIHLDVLSKLSMLLMDEEFSANLKNAKSVDEFLDIIDKAEAETGSIEDRLAGSEVEGAKGKLLAVTGCPTGIAHTYMAAEALEKAATAAGYSMKVETRGSGGTKNLITDAEIAEAVGIIVAADTQVPMDRFDGKKVIVTQVSDGISKADQLVEQITSGNVAVYKAANGAPKASSSSGGGAGHKFYTYLMNGVSHMLPFVVGGGILIALAFLIDGLLVDVNSLDEATKATFGNITPVADVLKTIGGTAFGLMLPILAGFIAMAIGDRPALALGFVGGAMAANGTSGFLGALVAGFFAGYVVLFLQKLCENLPEALEKIAPVLIYPVCGILIVGLAMMFIVEPIMGGINTALNNGLAAMGGTSKVLLGFVLGGMMAIDMGGPFNKAAYVFGTAMLAEGTTAGQTIMASVMVGGMVPPLVIALSTTFFKNRWTKTDRDAGIVNYIMGLSFISEGAIPFAAADPGRVLPSCIIGSAIAGAISAAAGCTSPAPHGGAWVIAIIGNPVMYFVALLVGSVVGCLILSFMKKKLSPEESGLAK